MSVIDISISAIQVDQYFVRIITLVQFIFFVWTDCKLETLNGLQLIKHLAFVHILLSEPAWLNDMVFLFQLILEIVHGISFKLVVPIKGLI